MTEKSLIEVPAGGARIEPGQPTPDNPIIPFIEGDGIGVDITPVMRAVVDAAVEKAYGGEREIHWMEVYAGEKSTRLYGADVWLPAETLEALREYSVSIKGPMTTPVGGGIRSLNVALRQELDLYVCLRPVRYFTGVPSPLKDPTQDRHGDLPREHRGHLRRHRVGGRVGGRAQAHRLPPGRARRAEDPLPGDVGHRHQADLARGNRAARAAARSSTRSTNDRESVTLVHKGNIMKFTEGAFRDWGYALAAREFGAELLDGGPWMTFKNPTTGREIVVKDTIADAFLQQILLRPGDYDVIATPNLNGDYISDALAAQVGGIGIAPGANIGDEVALFEATHGTAPKYAGQDKVNPGSLILSAEMMLRHLGWFEAADLIISSIEAAIRDQQVTYDFARLVEGATEVSCSAFGQAMIDRM